MKPIPSKFLNAAFLSALIFAFASCTATVRTPPPAARTEVIPVAPAGRAVWVPGRYLRRGRQYVWQPGHYVWARAGRTYVPGYWRQGPRGQVWVAARWR